MEQYARLRTKQFSHLFKEVKVSNVTLRFVGSAVSDLLKGFAAGTAVCVGAALASTEAG